jgi:hypothetical protein
MFFAVNWLSVSIQSMFFWPSVPNYGQDVQNVCTKGLFNCLLYMKRDQLSVGVNIWSRTRILNFVLKLEALSILEILILCQIKKCHDFIDEKISFYTFVLCWILVLWYFCLQEHRLNVLKIANPPPRCGEYIYKYSMLMSFRGK